LQRNRIPIFQVDAFAERLFEGNPAAVLILDEWLPEAVMQAIAGENNLAETAFARRNGPDWDLRWFTPTQEVDFCGHATLATAHVLASAYGAGGDLRFRTRIGDLRVSPGEAGYRLDLPAFAPEPAGDVHLPDGLLQEAPLSMFRNFENLYVELRDEEAVRGFIPDFERIARLDPLGFVITAAGKGHDFVSRCFFPAQGIPEDPVTGSAHATLAPYWAGKLGKSRLSAFQCSSRGGHLSCELAGERVFVEGKAITFLQGEVGL